MRISKVIHKGALGKTSEIKQNLQYWLKKSPQERLAAVDSLRQQLYGNVRLKKIAKVVHLRQRTFEYAGKSKKEQT